jgi:hypothetical protein
MTTTRILAILCVELLIAQRPYVFAQQQPAPKQASAEGGSQTLSPEQLQSLVAPIALYPDPILSQVLVASTYPLEIVEAARWLDQNHNLQGKQLTDTAAKQRWDASVQALVVMPELLKRLSHEIKWTSDLGNAFLATEEGVMEAVQHLRQQAYANGALKSTKEQTVSTTTDTNQSYIVVEPATPEVVYLPTYNPVAIWGPPPAYYPYPPIYYPPVPSTGAIVAASALSFGVGVAVGAIWSGGWAGWGWGCGWGRHNVVINNNFITRNNFSRVNVGNGNNWIHNPVHRAGMPYNNRNVANRYNGARANVNARPTAGQVQQRLNQGGASRLEQGNLGQGAVNRPGQGAVNRPSQGSDSRPSQGSVTRPSQRGGNRPGQAGGNRPAQGNLGKGAISRPSQGSANRLGQLNPGHRGGGTPMHNNRGPGHGGAVRGGGGRRR